MADYNRFCFLDPEERIKNNFTNISRGFKRVQDEISLKRFDVASYGAKGDGVTDDTAAIQACFDEVTPNSVVYFSKGIYLTTGVKLFRKPMVCVMGFGATLKLKSNSTKDVFIIEECERSSINGLTIDGNKANQAEPSNGLVIKAMYFSLLTDCNIMDCKNDGVQVLGYFDESDSTLFRGNDELHINRCFIQSNGRHGLFIDSVADLSIASNNIEFNGGNGIECTQTTGIASGNITFIDNQILSNNGHGVQVQNDCSRILFGYNHIRNNGQSGVRYVGGKQFIISNNNIHLNGRLFPYSAAILVGYTSNGIITNNIISCTDFSPTQGYAIEGVSMNSLVISGNIAKDNLQPGVILSDCTSVKAYGNLGIADVVI